MVLFADCKIPARHTFDHLCTDAVDICDSCLRSCGSRTDPRPHKRRSCWTRGIGHQPNGAACGSSIGNRRGGKTSARRDRSFKTEPDLNRTQRWPEIAIVMGSNPRNRPRSCENPFTGDNSKLFRADWLGHFRGGGFCRRPCFGGPTGSSFAGRISSFLCSRQRAIRSSIRPTPHFSLFLSFRPPAARLPPLPPLL